MQTTHIKQIGNGVGIVLPSDLLEQLNLSLQSLVSITLEGKTIVIKSVPRRGWDVAAQEMHKNGDDTLLIP